MYSHCVGSYNHTCGVTGQAWAAKHCFSVWSNVLSGPRSKPCSARSVWYFTNNQLRIGVIYTHHFHNIIAYAHLPFMHSSQHFALIMAKKRLIDPTHGNQVWMLMHKLCDWLSLCWYIVLKKWMFLLHKNAEVCASSCTLLTSGPLCCCAYDSLCWCLNGPLCCHAHLCSCYIVTFISLTHLLSKLT